MKLTIEPTADFVTLPDGTEAPVWVGTTAGGLRVFAVLSTLGCLPEDEEALGREVEADGGEITFTGSMTVHEGDTPKLN